MTHTAVSDRTRLVVGHVTTISVRPGVSVQYTGVVVGIVDSPEPNVGPASVVYTDTVAGARAADSVADLTGSEAALLDTVTFACCEALVHSGIHMLCEWFCVDGVRVFDLDGGCFNNAGLSVDVHCSEFPFMRPPTRADMSTMEDVELRVVSRVARDLASRCSLGPLGSFEVYGSTLIHVGSYPDRGSGTVKEYSWTRDCFGDVAVFPDGNLGAAVRAGVCTEMFTAAAESITHEVAEWFHVDGVRVFDPHPFATPHYDELRCALTFNASPFMVASASS